MAMTIDALERTLKKAYSNKINYQIDRDQELIEINFIKLPQYRNPEGEDCLRVLLLLAHAGEYLEVAATKVYDASECRHIGALCRLLLGVSLRTNVAQFSLDEADGEIRASAEMVLMDGTCTPNQLLATIQTLTSVVDGFHPHIVRCMATGEISFPSEDSIERPTLEDSGTGDVQLGGVDSEAALREALAKSREAGVKMWEGAAPARDVGRHG